MVMRAPATLRRARPEDRPALAAVLARAFHDDPITRWFYPSDRRREAQARRFFAIRLRQLADQDMTYTTADRSAAALWTLPGRWREDLRQTLMLWPALPALLPHLVRSVRAVTLIEGHHPARSHFYLSVLGTDPARQGEGLGSALLRPVLDLCDGDRVGAYLETGTERNVAFYARNGFRVTERLVLPGGGPPLWLMWRDPR
jgi:GNAT superfamily N-acetyltransferase